jgi:hypothetical protein
MLAAVLAQFRTHPDTALSAAAIATQLQVAPCVIEHMVRMLIRSGRVIEIEGGDSCGACPLQRICAGMPVAHVRRYTLVEHGKRCAGLRCGNSEKARETDSRGFQAPA